MRVTSDRAFRERLEKARSLASHKLPRGDNYAVLFEALGVYIEVLERRKGLARPTRTRRPPAPRAPTPGQRAPIPDAVRRAVLERDGWSCAYVAKDGRRCGSTWKLELHHRTPAPITGTSNVDDLEVRCFPHNGLHAREDYGEQLIDLVVRSQRRRARGGGTRTGETTPAGGSSPAPPVPA